MGEEGNLRGEGAGRREGEEEEGGRRRRDGEPRSTMSTPLGPFGDLFW